MVRLVHPELPDAVYETSPEHADVLAVSGWVVDGDAPEGQAPDGTLRPKDSAAKADWVAYAVATGADEDAAADLTRAQLIEAYGSH